MRRPGISIAQRPHNLLTDDRKRRSIPSGAHRIEGVGIGFMPPLWNAAAVNEIQTVSTDDANRMCRRLAKKEGLFVGTSSGGNVVVALRIAERLGPEATVGTILVDSGLRYLSTDVYRARSTTASVWNRRVWNLSPSNSSRSKQVPFNRVVGVRKRSGGRCPPRADRWTLSCPLSRKVRTRSRSQGR